MASIDDQVKDLQAQIRRQEEAIDILMKSIQDLAIYSHFQHGGQPDGEWARETEKRPTPKSVWNRAYLAYFKVRVSGGYPPKQIVAAAEPE
ncbi:hypothetical protein [Oceaniglobus ichthyenteri]|uniref:hypothetical protein n=1 Tax=Oceaniglobus ichthyenteri TaxID=2136177 RepID=UPI000F82260A|nr:hypothetical protein [Oceaniglobus ichthyenteri]